MAEARPERHYELSATHPAAIAAWARRDPGGVAVRWKADGVWQEWTRHQYAARCGQVAAALQLAGLKPGDRVGIAAASSPRWVIAAQGTQGAGGVTVGAYATSAPAQYRYVFSHSGARFVFTGDATITRNVLAVLDDLPDVARVIVFDPSGLTPDELSRVQPFDDFLTSAELDDDDSAVTYFESRVAALDPDDLATIVYTSGTTGDPKGAMHSFRTIGQVAEIVGPAMGYRPDDQYIVYLPLNHTAEHTYTIVLGAQSGWTLNFAQSMMTLTSDLAEIRPTVMFGVPRIFEKVREQLEASGTAPSPEALRPFGFDRLRVAVCGGAPLSKDLVEFFAEFGLRMCNTYGMTEAGAIASAWDREPQPDTCGVPFPEVEFRVADDGEALVKSGGLCLGYYRDTAATDEMFTPDGFLRTGDIVERTASGEVRVVDRKKDIIITKGGKNISPSGIQFLLAKSPVINQALVVGNDRRYLVALIEIAPEPLKEYLAARGVTNDAYDELVTLPETLAAVEAAVAEANESLSHPEQIKRWALLPRPLVANDPVLTPTMKIKRKPFEARYAELIDSLYE